MVRKRLGHARRHTGGPFPAPSPSAVIAIGVVLALLAMAAVIAIGRRHDQKPAQRSAAPWVVPPGTQEPQPPIPLLSDPPSPPPAAAASGDRRPATRHSPPAPTRSRPATRLLPTPGTRLSLLATGTTDLRLRHQDFRMRLATVGPGSPGSARADATFVLRRGLADERCVSLESVNFPGRFMRHQNFVLLLQPLESSRLFAADATFCPRAVGTEADFLLRSVNFPDRYLTSDGRRMLLSPVPAGSAQSFRAAAGL